jgi:hypothetical protein
MRIDEYISPLSAPCAEVAYCDDVLAILLISTP